MIYLIFRAVNANFWQLLSCVKLGARLQSCHIVQIIRVAMSQKTVLLDDIVIANDRPFVLFGGLNVLEDEAITMKAADLYKEITDKHNIPFIFKASYDKANRSSIHSYRGAGLDEGLRIFQKVKDELGVKIITDVHEIDQCQPVADVVDIIQIPAFLARQTDLVAAMSKTGAIVNIKKPQYMSPYQITNIVDKFAECGQEQTIICERGHSLGYDNLVVDPMAFGVMKEMSNGTPIICDTVHASQMRLPGSEASGGRRALVPDLTRAVMAIGIAGLFIEAYEDPDQAKCDGPSAIPFNKLEEFLVQAKAVDDLVKSMDLVEID